MEDDLRLFREQNPVGVAARKKGLGSEQELTAAGRATPVVVAEAVVGRAAERLHALQSKLILAPDGVNGKHFVRVENLGGGDSILIRREDGRVDAVNRATTRPYEPQAVGALVPVPSAEPPTTRASGGKRYATGRHSAIAPAGQKAADHLKQLSTFLLTNCVSCNTATTYDSAWRNHWVPWTIMRGIGLFQNGKDPVADEDETLLFIAHKAMVSLYAHGTIHVMLYAIRQKHLFARYPDPLKDSVRIKMAMKGVWRLQGGPLRKIPCSMSMITWLADHLNWESWDEFLVLLAVVFMFLFLLRSREALRKGSEADEKQAVQMLNLVFRCKGVEVLGEAIQSADEVVLLLGASKTDPNGQGSVANHFESPGNRLCIVALLKRAQRMKPSHFARAENFLFTAENGRVLHRDVVAKYLEEAAKAEGAPAGAASIISLRSGGASAMWDAGLSSDEIKQRGRWASDCFKIYIWPGHDRSRNVASMMLESKFSLMASLAAYRRHE